MELLKINGISKKYMTKKVLEDIELTLGAGKIYGLLGPNGSGKTTLLKIIAGLTQPTKGSLKVNGRGTGVSTKQEVSYLPAINHLPKWMNVKTCINFYKDFFLDFNLELATERVEEMGLRLNQKVSSLSTGMVGRLKIALAMSRQSKLYLLDEPLNGLDPISRERVLEMILKSAREDSSIVLATHIIKEVESILDEVIFLNDGRIILAGNVDDLRLARKKSIDELYREVYGNV